MSSLKIILFITFLFPSTINALNYYWVGGDGSWSDLEHWATTSGGTSKHIQTPTANDDVFFDANSFNGANQTVFIVGTIAFCKTMDWTGVTNLPTFTGGALATLNIYGGLKFSPNMTMGFQGDFYFGGGGLGNDINFAGHKVFKRIIFENKNGEWLLKNKLVADSTLWLKEGTLNSMGEEMAFPRIVVEAKDKAELRLGSSMVTLSGQKTTILGEVYFPFQIRGNNSSVLGESSLIKFTSSASGISLLGAYANTLKFNDVSFVNPNGTVQLLSGVSTSTVEFNNLTFESNAEIQYECKINTLTLRAGKNYQFEGTKKYTISKINAIGTCIKSILIKSSVADKVANFDAKGAIINIDFATIQDIKAINGTFNATNSLSIGQTSGWSVVSKVSQALYWVGGAGNWDDAQHWSLTSGGAGGACIPTPVDDVFFDVNSGLTNSAAVVLNSENAFCRDMLWNNTPNNATLKGDTLHNLRIFRNLTFMPNMNFKFNGFTYFESTLLGNKITSAGNVFNRDVLFVGSGSWELQDSFVTKSALKLLQGTLKTNGNNIFGQRFESKSTSIRKLELGASRLTFTNYFYTGTYNVDGKGLQIDAGTSTIVLSSSYGSSMNHYFPSSDTLHYHNVEFRDGYNSIYTYGVNMSFNKVTFNNNSTITDFPLTIDTLIYGSRSTNILQGGYTKNYVMELRVKALIINGDCDKGFTTIRKSATTRSAFFSSNENITVQNAILVEVGAKGSGVFTANNSIADGITTKWIVNKAISRILYWVGDGGYWTSRAHWSLSSGGIGGECIPTPVDDVVFDQNSFTSSGQTVYLDHNNNTCHDIDFSKILNKPQFTTGSLHIFGSLKHAPKANLPRSFIVYNFYGKQNHTIETNGQYLLGVYFLGRGTYQLSDSLYADYAAMQKGHFDTEGKRVSLDYFSIENSQDTVMLSLDSTYFYIRNVNGSFYPFYVNTKKLIVNSGKSIMDIGGKDARVYLSNKLFARFNTMFFSNPAGKASITKIDSFDVSYSKLLFYGDGSLLGTHQADSLIGSPGHVYAFDKGKTQKVTKYLQIIGNNCQSIQLISTLNSQKANLEMPNTAKIVADFIQMQDQNAVGGAVFNAGSHSTDVAKSNKGWTFDVGSPILNNDGFLGADTALCKIGDKIILKAYNYSITKDITFKWQDGSANPTITVDKTGLYHVTVTFGNNCKISDSINIFNIQQINLELGKDTTLCEGKVLLLNADVKIANAKYLWQDSTTNSTFSIKTPGLYKVEVNIQGCKTKDSINVDFLETPKVSLGNDTTLCEKQLLTLKTGVQSGATYLWQDGSTTIDFEPKNSGKYSVTVTKNGCSSSDSMQVVFNPLPIVELGKDTVVCENQKIILNAQNDGASFVWSDNSKLQSLNVNKSAVYAVTVTKNNCSSEDSIKVFIQPIPKFSLGKDTAICEKGTLIVGNSQYQLTWQDGTVSNNFEVKSSGLYFAKATENGCVFSDSIKIAFGQTIQINLGHDTLLCEGTPFSLSAKIPSANYLWSNGEKNQQTTIKTSDTYWILVEKDGCEAKDSITIDYKKCSPFQFFAPTAFSPNDDGYNDEWLININPEYPILDFWVQVYNRWGTLVFETHDPTVGWAGFYGNKNDDTQKAQSGVYTYRLYLTYKNTETKRDKILNTGGELILIRE